MESGFPSRPLIEHIYLHIPFCTTKCGYCSFYSEVYHTQKVCSFIDTLHKEITLYQQQLDMVPQTIYFGGGTPSLLSPLVIGEIISHFDTSACKEITLEMNPITVTSKYLGELAGTPVNRISLGVQSFLDKELEFLERKHKASQVREKFELLHSFGYHNISADLIYALPNQSKNDVQYSIERLLELEPEHISTYCLSIEENTPFYKKGLQSAEDDTAAEMYEQICAVLTKSGYVHYEISNFARKGFESKHNLAYWNCRDYLGLGAGATGMVEKNLYHNADDISQYQKDVDSGIIYPNNSKQTDADFEQQYIFMNMRKADGLDLAAYKERFGKDFLRVYQKVIEKYAKMNLLTIRQDSVALNSNAFFVSNEILSEFM
ncbi:MAG TPA: radical SAM family heme chaperone HemW [Candidatus Cloacimonadota bacterium]|nr:radical SAM family heme chaperone HemW [Candidatus Cloacimonadota bacterium]HPT71408.1 radical SAM family heme chaperone HemW [Candidatus Cloacimonadota bacterium]